MNTEAISILSAAELDALVAQHVTGEEPEIFWEDCHGCFQFASEADARRALADPYYQQFLPEVDWDTTVLREVRAFRPYCAEPTLAWMVIGKAVSRWGPLSLWRENGRWCAEFGAQLTMQARTPSVAICLAALSAAGLRLEVDHDRVDAQINQYLLLTRAREEVALDQEKNGV